MPHKYNADRRHHIPRARYKVTNWKAYEAGLRQRGSLTIWFTGEAIAAWQAAPRTTPGGQARYSDLAIETSLILRTVFHQPLRQTEGLVGSLLDLMGLDLPVPDHSTLSRRSRTLTIALQAACCMDVRDGVRVGLFRCSGSRHHAAQIQCRSPPPYSAAEATCDELGRL
jgi:hypothetical protein